MKSAQQSQQFVVVGAGMVGLSLALGLRAQGHQVTVIERGQRPSYGGEPELRVSALSHRSRQLLSNLDVWQQLPSQRLGPYTAMTVWDHDSFGQIDFAATEVNAADLGAIVENSVLEQQLWDHALTQGVVILSNSEVKAFEQTAQQVRLQLADDSQLQADYLCAADGGRSAIRQQLGLPLTFWDYQQQGIVAVIQTEQPHQGVARQVFLPTGPVALLPLADPHFVSLVWSCDDDFAEQLASLSDADFNKRLQAVSDQCLGQLTVQSKRVAFPLRMQYAQRWVEDRVIILGDAAHTIHPLAGQGANLGLADVDALLERTQIGLSARNLRAWERERKAAAVTMIAAMESFKRGFGTQQPLAKLVRGFGFQLADKFAPLKQKLARIALGE